MSKASDNVFPRFLISEGGSTATPAAARVTIYAKSDGLLYSKDDAGVETLVSGGPGGAAEITDIPTADTTTTNVLSPDGIGGVEWRAEAAGGGGGSGPVVYAAGRGGGNTQNPASTIKAPVSGHRLIVAMNLVGRAATGVTCTNVTFTKMFGYSSTGGSYYEVWVGVVAGAGGTTLTVTTGSSNYSSWVYAEVDDALTPTAGAEVHGNIAADAFGYIPVGPLTGATPGAFVVVMEGADNTTNAHELRMNCPGFALEGAAANGTTIGLTYAPSSGVVSGLATNSTGGLACYYIVGEIT